MTITPLGDQSLVLSQDNEDEAVQVASQIRKAAPGWLQDVVPAYSSVGVFFDSNLIDTESVSRWIQESLSRRKSFNAADVRTLEIPVCYDFQLDLERVAQHCHLRSDDVIARHLNTIYRIYAIGFSPGFPYMGYLPTELQGVPRLESPRIRLEPGSVGITGKQTSIYPMATPGGWNILGRTPLVLVDVADGFFPLRVGDRVQFKRIDVTEFRRLEGERLSIS